MEKRHIEFDKEDVFAAEIQPVLDRLKSLLHHYDIPYFFAAAIKSNEQETNYIYDSHDVWSISSQMKDDKIPGFIKVVNSFRSVPPDDNVQVDKKR